MVLHWLAVSTPAASRPDRQLHRRADTSCRRTLHGHGIRVEQSHAGGPHVTLSEVALNDVIMIVAFAPIVALLLGSSAIIVP